MDQEWKIKQMIRNTVRQEIEANNRRRLEDEAGERHFNNYLKKHEENEKYWRDQMKGRIFNR